MHKGNRSNIVVHDKKVAFMILKKCASVTFITTMLVSLGYKEADRWCYDEGPRLSQVITRDLIKMDKYELDKLDYDKIVWVRNPFDRLVSGWYDRVHKVDNKDTMEWYGIPNTISFKDFIDWVCSIPDEEMNVHFHQQTFNITIDGRLVPNIIIKLENLKEEWEELRKRLQWLSPVTVHMQATKEKGNYKDYYTDEMIDKVTIRFKDDLHLLDYTFKG